MRHFATVAIICAIMASRSNAAPFIVLDAYASQDPTERLNVGGLNNLGQVVTYGIHIVDPSPSPYLLRRVSYIYLGSNSSLTLVESMVSDNWGYPSLNTDSGFQLSGAPSINNAGQIAYAARPTVSTEQSHVYLWENGIRTTLMSSNSSLATGVGSLNDHEAVLAFGGTQHHLIDNGITTYTGVQSNRPDLNNNGQFAYAVSPQPWHVEIRDANGIAHDITGPASMAMTSVAVAMNDLGQVVHSWNNLDLYLSGIGVSPTLLVDLGPTQRPYDVAINNNGDIAFTTNNSSLTEAALYFLPAGSTTPIELLREGTTFQGHFLTDIRISSESLNDLGQLAFSYFNDTNQTGVVVIQPLPESGSLTLATLTVAGLVVLTRRRIPPARRTR